MSENTGKFTQKDFDRALLSMDPGERMKIKKMVQVLDQEMKVRGFDQGQKIMFGQLSALELLARLGMFINNGGKQIE